MKISKKGLLAGLAGLGLLGVGIYSVTKKKGDNGDFDVDITEECEVEEEDEVEDSEES